MKRNIIILFVLLISINNLFAGVFDNYKKLNTLETNNFEIIFDDASINEGFQIYNSCETIYNNIITLFNLKNRTQKIEVVITSDIQEFNAYFSLMPSPHIVLYNTIATDNSLNVFNENYILNIFKHELTHALTLMGENNFIRRFFSQSITNSLLNVTSFNAEGYAVLSESNTNEGRLNSNLYRSRLLQGRLENKFLKYNEVQGNRDTYPSDVFYLYGSFFNKFLLEKYGIEKYQEYVYQLSKFQILFIDPNYAFKKVFNESIYDVYDLFKESFLIINTKEIDTTNYDYTPSSLIKENNTALVYQIRNDSVKNIETGDTIIKYISNSYNISYNDDTFVISAIKNNPLEKTETIIYKDGEKDSFILDHFKMGIYFKSNIVGIYNEGQKQYIAFLKNKEIVKKIPLSNNESVQKIDIINDKIVFLSRYNSKDTISIIQNDNQITSYQINDDIEVIDFSIDNNKIILSTIKYNQLPRLSYIEIDTNKLFINSFDIIGGVFNPIKIDNNIYFISKYTDNNKLIKTSIYNFNFKEYPLKKINRSIKDYADITYDLSIMGNYNLFKYIFKGSFFPFVLPDTNGIASSIYFNSLDPAEFLNTELIANLNLNNNFDYNLVLNLSSITGNKNSRLSFYLDGQIINSQNNTNFAIESENNRIFENNNNNFIYLGFYNKTDIVSYIGNSSEIGYGFTTNVGPTLDNKFSYYLAYNIRSIYDYSTNSFYNQNLIKANLRIPYLIPYIKENRFTINLPLKISYEYNLNNFSQNVSLSLLLFNMEIQKSFVKIPYYLNNIQVYLNYKEDVISAYTVFTSSITQTKLNFVKLYPGFRYYYDLSNKELKLQVSFFNSF